MVKFNSARNFPSLLLRFSPSRARSSLFVREISRMKNSGIRDAKIIDRASIRAEMCRFKCPRLMIKLAINAKLSRPREKEKKAAGKVGIAMWPRRGRSAVRTINAFFYRATGRDDTHSPRRTPSRRGLSALEGRWRGANRVASHVERHARNRRRPDPATGSRLGTKRH